MAGEVAAVEVVLVEAVLGDALAEVDEADDETFVEWFADTGFNTVADEAVDEKPRICIALPPELRSISPKSFFGGFV